MKIVIDARLMNQTGVGRYIRNLVTWLGRIDKDNKYVLLVNKADNKSVELPNTRWSVRLVNIPWHSITEQIRLPGILASEKPDLVHIPYFNIPILYRGPMVVTIHDLIIDHFDTGKASTLPYWKYLIRRIGYKLVMWIGLHRARKVIAVSESTKNELIEHYLLPEKKIIVTYEGVDEKVKSQKSKVKRIVEEPYFLYVGNAYPHKNLETLLMAFQEVLLRGKRTSFENIKIVFVFVGSKDLFYERLETKIQEMKFSDSVVFFGAADDSELINLYDHALALVCPSLMEGFGLPALEAVSRGCPVICSDITVFREIMGNAVQYFPVKDSSALSRILTDVISEDKKLVDSKDFVNKFSWKKMTQHTQELYECRYRI